MWRTSYFILPCLLVTMFFAGLPAMSTMGMAIAIPATASVKRNFILGQVLQMIVWLIIVDRKESEILTWPEADV
jgi:hypothetical protein